MHSTKILRFGPFQADLSEKTVFRGSERLALTPKEFDLLACLLTSPGKLVTKDEILAAVWPDTIVEESNLSVHISKLRRALGENPTEPLYIETVARRGYRFIAPVTEAEPEPPVIGNPQVEEPARAVRPAAKRSRAPVLAAAAAVMLGIPAYVWYFNLRPPAVDWNPYPITSSQGLENSPAVSPDANYIVYSVLTPYPNKGLWIQKVGSETSSRLTEQFDYNAAWSPDGKEIAFIRFLSEIVDLRVRPAFGGEDRVLRLMDYDGPLPGPMLHYSADGQWILTSDGAGIPTGVPPRRLIAISTRTGETRKILEPVPGTSGDSAPVLSPLQDRLAFCRCISTASCDLYVVPVHDLKPTGPPMRLSDSPSPELRAVFLKDGSLIYPIGPPDSRRMCRTYFDVFGRPHSSLISGIGEDVSLPSAAYTASGKIRLAYTRNTADLNIWDLAMKTADGEVENNSILIASTRSDATPAYSPDGRRIAFTSTRSGQWEIWICGSDGANCIQLTHLGPAYSNFPSWSSDGKWITFDSRPTSQAHIYIMAADGGPGRPLTSGPSSNLEAVWSPDGKWLYFSSNRSGRFEIYRSPAPAGGSGQLTYEQITKDGGTSPRLSPDGGTLVFRGPNGRYYSKSFADPEPRLLTYDGLIAPPALGPAGIAYGYVAQFKKGYVARFPLGAETGELLRPINLSRPSGMTRSPDGRHVLYVVNDRVESDIMVADLAPFR